MAQDLSRYRPALIEIEVDRRFDQAQILWSSGQTKGKIAPKRADVKRKLLQESGGSSAYAMLAKGIQAGEMRIVKEEIREESSLLADEMGEVQQYCLIVNFGLQGVPKFIELLSDLEPYVKEAAPEAETKSESEPKAEHPEIEEEIPVAEDEAKGEIEEEVDAEDAETENEE